MATRISFSTTYPDRMGLLKGKFTRFPEKLITMIDPYAENENLGDLILQVLISGIYDFKFNVNYPPKTTTIRSNYEYWKSKEGQLLQPFFWAGKPYRSKHVVFCPEVRLKRVIKVEIKYHKEYTWNGEPWDGEVMPAWESVQFLDDPEYGDYFLNEEGFINFTQNEGFDQPDHFWMWFNSDFDGAYLELENGEG